MKYSPEELANVQNYLLLKGHACPTISNGWVHYYDRTGGQWKTPISTPIATILEEIHNLRKVPIEHYSDKSAFEANTNRLGIGHYQVMEINGKLLCREDLRLELRGLYDD